MTRNQFATGSPNIFLYPFTFLNIGTAFGVKVLSYKKAFLKNF